MPNPARVARRDCGSQQPAAPGPAASKPKSRWCQAMARVMATSLALLLLLLPQGCGRDRAGQDVPLATSAPVGPIQEVAPPLGVQQLASALAEHSPKVRILAPVDGSTLPDGPWTLRLQLRDWPLTDAGELGLGAHVVVQLDDEPPQRIAGASRQTGNGSNNAELSLAMQPLRPGSHRLTVFAARPWGEVVKSPGASSQIQLQRVAPTPLRVPAPGSPQLIAVSPGPEPRHEPVLVDWLLLDAPLQGLREGDGSWRLRVSVNGDSFLVDQNSPLWLKGWRNGSNSLQLDLVDGRGEPLNPPFNSLVADVVIQANAPRPIWLSRLEPAALARLLGQDPPEAEPTSEPTPAAPAAPAPDLTSAPLQEPGLDAAPARSLEQAPGPGPEPVTPQSPEQSAAAPTSAAPSTATDRASATNTLPDQHEGAGMDGQVDAGVPQAPSPEPPLEAVSVPVPVPMPVPLTQPEHPPAPAGPTIPSDQTNPDRIAPSTRLSGSAREQVRDDGSLIQPRGRGPLAGLREKLGS